MPRDGRADRSTRPTRRARGGSGRRGPPVVARSPAGHRSPLAGRRGRRRGSTDRRRPSSGGLGRGQLRERGRRTLPQRVGAQRGDLGGDRQRLTLVDGWVRNERGERVEPEPGEDDPEPLLPVAQHSGDLGGTHHVDRTQPTGERHRVGRTAAAHQTEADRTTRIHSLGGHRHRQTGPWQRGGKTETRRCACIQSVTAPSVSGSPAAASNAARLRRNVEEPMLPRR